MNHDACNILVTGATGLIGGELVLSLAQRGADVHALVRAPSDDAAASRLRERLQKSDRFDERLAARVLPLRGDTMAAHFGLAQLPTPTCIVHCAADTSFRDDPRVWETNVRGAENLIAMARAIKPAPRVFFISTASVVTAPVGGTIAEIADYAGHDNTYTRSKRHAETLIRASGLDAVIVRPSIVLSRGVRDRSMAMSILWAVPVMEEMGDVPVNPDSRLDIVPADHVADAIAGLALKARLRHRCYHLSAGSKAPRFGDLLDALAAQFPRTRRIRPLGSPTRARNEKRRTLLMRPLSFYLPFMNADVSYCNNRLAEELGFSAAPQSAIEWLPTVMRQVGRREAMLEMARP